MKKPKVVYEVTFLVTDKSDEPVTKAEVKLAVKDLDGSLMGATLSKISVVDHVG